MQRNEKTGKKAEISASISTFGHIYIYLCVKLDEELNSQRIHAIYAKNILKGLSLDCVLE